MSVKIAINGFGRIGRLAFRRILDKHPSLEVVAVNDLSDNKTLAHLLKHDSSYGTYSKEVLPQGKNIVVDGKEIKVFQEKDPSLLPWRKLEVDIVLECSGVFREYQGAVKHLDSGAKKVIISAPSKDPEKINSFVLGVNEDKFDLEKDKIVDMGSCTTNCLAPIAKVINDNFGIISGYMTTVHSYTNDQRILDLPHKDLRRARAAAVNVIPTTTGAAKAIGNVIPELKGKLNGMALRVPTATVSVLDLICHLEKDIEVEEINSVLEKASQERMKGILKIEKEPLVSSDYIGNSFSATVDSELTMAGDNLVKVVAWYDNEWAYACRLVQFAEYISGK
jgi:glyceraldehyde 3-phosphate dehydrogenase